MTRLLTVMTLYALCLMTVASSWAADNGQAGGAGKVDVDHFKIWYKVYINGSGLPQSVEILRVHPQMTLDDEAKEKLIAPVRTWTLNPIVKGGKPIAGEVVVVVDYN